MAVLVVASAAPVRAVTVGGTLVGVVESVLDTSSLGLDTQILPGDSVGIAFSYESSAVPSSGATASVAGYLDGVNLLMELHINGYVWRLRTDNAAGISALAVENDNGGRDRFSALAGTANGGVIEQAPWAAGGAIAQASASFDLYDLLTPLLFTSSTALPTDTADLVLGEITQTNGLIEASGLDLEAGGNGFANYQIAFRPLGSSLAIFNTGPSAPAVPEAASTGALALVALLCGSVSRLARRR